MPTRSPDQQAGSRPPTPGERRSTPPSGVGRPACARCEALEQTLAQSAEQHASSEAQLEAQTRALDVFERLCTLLASVSDPAELAPSVTEMLSELVLADAAVLRLRDEATLVVRASIGVPATEANALANQTLEIDAAQAQGSDVLVEERAGAALKALFGSDRMRAALSLPLRANDQLLGLLHLGYTKALALSDARRELLVRAAAPCAAAFARLESRAALHDQIRSRDDVLGVVAHDLRNPINVISMAAHTLLNRFSETSARRPIERIVRGAQRADRMIQDLLQISAIEGGQLSIEPAVVDTAALVFAALESQQSLAEGAQVIIATDLTPGLPAVMADDERVLEVIENLVGNAIKFTGPGGSVTVGATPRGNDVCFWVKDSGAGIPEDQLPHIFDRFWQARRRDRRGTGLGLSICQAIVSAHGGEIWAESKIGKGTTMRFTIPSVPAQVERTELLPARILLVDDRKENLTALSAVLERPDYQLVTARSGSEALSLALREHFAVALIDVAMPGMTGLEVATHMKALARSRDTPIIFITAFGDDPEEIHRAYSAGGADYLVKPLDAEIVRKKVAVFVDLDRRQRLAKGTQARVKHS
jgi:signal transduction histidine kinase/ActR/RegA family two-component response regulator